MKDGFSSSRRRFISITAAASAAVVADGTLRGVARAQQAPAFIPDRPVAPFGLQIGDVNDGSALIWSRADRASRLVVEWDTSPRFRRPQRVQGPHALETSDFTARVDLTDLPDGQDIFVRASFQSLDRDRVSSEPVLGHFRTPGRGRRQDVRFVWGGDTAGQGWGIDLARGGMTSYRAMKDARPDFFIHSGDNIYADGPMAEAVVLADGTTWRNAFLDVEPAKRKVAETLDEYRGCYRYNLRDENLRAFNAAVPQIWQWDDHEVINNWSDAKDITADARYTEKRVQTLVARGQRAFLDYAPIRPHGADESERVYRKLSWGADLDVFVLDMRSYRGPNSTNLQDSPSDATAFLGWEQLRWLRNGLRQSTATWKIIAADMPIGLNVGDGKDAAGNALWEAIANGENTDAKGREFEIAELLAFIKHHRIDNVVWLTADVHYCAAHHYDPSRAAFKNFDPFWEFVAGPLHAGTFGPNTLDATFGPQVVFQKAPPAGQSNLPPSAGFQFFGQVDLDARSKTLTVSFKDATGAAVFSQTVEPQNRWR